MIDEKFFEELKQTLKDFESPITNLKKINFNLNEKNHFFYVVDGGSSILMESSSFSVGIYRAGYMAFQNGTMVKKVVTNTEYAILKESSNEILSPEKQLEILRKELEKNIIVDCINTINSIRTSETPERLKLIIVDGEIPLDAHLLKLVIENKIIFVGVVKRCGLKHGLITLQKKLQRETKNEKHARPWYYILYDKYDDFKTRLMVKFHPLTDFVFRTEIYKPVNFAIEDVLGTIAQYCNDPIYIGYPYPLAMIHNLVAIDNMTKETYINKIEEYLLHEGYNLADFNIIFEDFHALLDENI